jgi:hypothetical protein
MLPMRKISLLLLLLLLSNYLSAQISVTASAGTPGPTTYTTLKAAIDAVNAGTHQGVINVSVTASTTETAPTIINASGTGSASYTSLIIKPAAGATPTISGSLASAALINLNAANNITIDGSNTAGGSTRDLTLTNTNTTGSSIFTVGSNGTTPLNNFNLKNCHLLNGSNGSTMVNFRDYANAGGTGYFTNITIHNNNFKKGFNAIFLYGTPTAAGSNVTVTQNDFIGGTTDFIRQAAIYIQGMNTGVISGNIISDMYEPVNASNTAGIWLATGTSNININNNTISDFVFTTTASALVGAYGILVTSDANPSNINVFNNNIKDIASSSYFYSGGIVARGSLTGVNIYNNKIDTVRNVNDYGAVGIGAASTNTNANIKIYNNFISNVFAYGYALSSTIEDNGNGIALFAGGGYAVDHNTVVLNSNATLTGAHRASCLLITSALTTASSVSVRNNIFINNQTVGNASSRFCINSAASNSVFSSINYNNLYATSGNLARNSAGTLSTTLAALQTDLGGNANSINVNPVFVSATDLHLQMGVNAALDNLGTPISGITTDIDNDTRSTTTPDMGADEFSNCYPVTIGTQPVDKHVCINANTTFSVSVTSTGSYAYQWQVNTGSGFTDIANGGIYSGATTNTLTLTSVTTAYNNYTYRCVINNSGNPAACNATNSNVVTLFTHGPVAYTHNVSICPSQVATFSWNGINNATTGAIYNTTTQYGCDSVVTLSLALGNYLVRNKDTTVCNGIGFIHKGVTYNITQIVRDTFTNPSGCDSIVNYNLTIAPTVAATATPNTASICTGTATSIALTSTVTGTTFSRTVTQTGATGGTAGTGASIAQTLTNSGTTNGTVTYVVTPTANGCSGLPINVVVTVKPKPTATVTPSTQTICSGNSTNVALTSNITGSTFAWTVTQTNVTGATGGTGTSIAQALTGSTASGTATYTITPTNNGCSGNTATATITVQSIPVQPGAITGAIQPCVGSTQVYNVAAVTGATSYTWTLPSGWTGTSTTNSISVVVGANPGNITVKANNNCGSSPIATKEVSSMPVLTPTIAISTPSAEPYCSGIPMTFNAAVTNGGTNPSYQWKVNNLNVGPNLPSYTYEPVDGDVIKCVLTSNYACVSSNNINSNSLTLDITGSVTPTITIDIPENHLCSEIIANFTALYSHSGTFQWKVNNNDVGTNSNTFSYLPANNDVVTCVLSTQVVCATNKNPISNSVPMTVVPTTIPTIGITDDRAGIVTAQEPITFTASISGQGTYGHQISWFKNDEVIPGANNNTLTLMGGSEIKNKNTIHARLLSLSPCSIPDTALSNVIKVSNTTGINQLNAPEAFKIYPNPTTGLVNIEGLVKGDNINVLDALGRTVRKHTATNDAVQVINLNGLAQGMYFVLFTDKDQQQWQVKITKE